MPRIEFSRRMPAFSLFVTLGAFVALFATLGSPSDPKNAFLFGYSLERIILGGGLLMLGIALLFLTWKLFHNPQRSQHLWDFFTQPQGPGNAALFISLAIFLICWIILFMPPYRLGVLTGYVQRLFPIIIWLTVTSVFAITILFLERKRITKQSLHSTDWIIFKVSGVIFGLFILLGILMLATGIGYREPEDYWYGAGVPILGLQVLFSLLIGALVLGAEAKLTGKREIWFDGIVFIGLWVVAAWFWAREPLVPNYFMPDTADNVIYPYSDGATFDMGAQYALIGQGLFNSQYFDRALYSAFLAYLHILFGQDYSVIMAVQAAVYAVFPAVIYLLGRELHSRALGASAGVLLAIRGVNTLIASKWIDTASPKMVLTDFPTAIGIAIFMFFFLRWLKEPNKPTNLIWAGATFGLTLMVRTHALTLLPIALVFIPFVVRIHWKQFVTIALLLLLGLLTVTLPWEVRNQTKGIPMFYMYYSRIELLLRYRYGILGDAYIPPQDADVAQTRTVGLRQRSVPETAAPVCNSLPCSIVNHFVHNITTSIVSFPLSLTFDDLWNTVKADTPYWKRDWNEGQIGSVGVGLLIANLALISLGVGAIWKRSQGLTLFPILLFLAYLFTNSLGLTSGGRYIAPVDWVMYLFYLAGGLQLVCWFLKWTGLLRVVEEQPVAAVNSFQPLTGNQYFKLFPALILILGIGALLPASEAFFEPRYQVRPTEETLAELEQSGLLEQSGYSRDDLAAFLSQPNAMITVGQALYPRYYRSDEGEPDRSTYYRALDYRRLVLTVIGPYNAQHQGVVIPGDPPPFSLHTTDVVVLGCWNTTYYAPFIDAVVVFVTSDEGYVYNRAPRAPLMCPLDEP